MIYPPSKLPRSFLSRIYNIRGTFFIELCPCFFDTLTYEWIVRTSEYESLDIR